MPLAICLAVLESLFEFSVFYGDFYFRDWLNYEFSHIYFTNSVGVTLTSSLGLKLTSQIEQFFFYPRLNKLSADLDKSCSPERSLPA